ncbi:hypothetical protein GGF42_002087 [Coemansia sp. RSA 2424]|nr:hypothetical protein GGF42_002087 [Coemansia sp. RSA 2424]
MEYFTDNVESQTIELAVLDTLSSFSNIPFIYHFENMAADNIDLFMPMDILRVTFYKALLEFPILAGHLHVGYDGRASVVIDPNSLNLPEYRESTCEVHYDQLKAASYNWDMLPKDLMSVSMLTTAGADGVIKLANFHCAQLCDNSGMLIFANMSHYVVNGVGFCVFMGRWAEYCQLACSKVGAVLQHHEFTFNRNIINKMLSFKCRPISDAAYHLFFVPKLAASALAWISPILRGRILSTFLSTSKAEAHMFHISKDRLEALCSSLVDYIPSNMRLSDNDLIASLTSMTIINGLNHKPNSNGGVLGWLKATCGCLFYK